MKLILTHEQADFDAIASLLGANLVFKDAYALLPRNINRNVSDYIKRYQSELGFTNYNNLPNELISDIILVDTQSLVTIKGFHEGTSVKVIDHHPRKETIKENWQLEIGTSGSCTTLLVQKIKDLSISINKTQATLLLLGIYEDTGSLGYSSTTPDDMKAAAFLMENGADLTLAGNYLNPPLSGLQQLLYDRLLVDMESQIIHDQVIITAKANALDINDEISSVAHKLRDFLEPDALFLLVLTKQGIRLVARGTRDSIDVAQIASVFGGGGHARAASALIRSESRINPDEYELLLNHTYKKLKESIVEHVKPRISVRQIMSKNPTILTPDTPISEVAKLMQRYGFEGYPVVHDRKIIGLLNRRSVERAISHKMDLPVSSLMDAGSHAVALDDAVEKLQLLMASTGWGQIPVIDQKSGDIVGIVTRTDLLKTQTSHRLAPDQSKIVKKLENAIPKARLSLLRIIADEANKYNIPLYIVGGFVRDLLLGIPSLDFDIVVEGDAIFFLKNLIKTYGGRSIVHSRFGTAKWLLTEAKKHFKKTFGSDNETFLSDLPDHLDFITARTEFYEKPAALPTVESSSIKMDLHRRDFTINTLALRLDGESFGKIYDYWGGYEDLLDGQVRILHTLSFVDDATRLMRAVRFEQRFGFSIEERTLALLKESLPLLKAISGTRLCHEFELIFLEANVSKMMRRLADLEILMSIHPSLTWNENLSSLIQKIQNLEVPTFWKIPEKNDRLSIKQFLTFIYWLEEVPMEKVHEIAQLFKLPAKLIKSIIQYQELTNKCKNFSPSRPSTIYHFLKDYEPIVLFACYLKKETLPEARIIEDYILRLQHISPETTGSDLKNLGLPPSPIYAKIIGDLRDRWLDGDISSIAEEKTYLKQLLVQLKNT